MSDYSSTDMIEASKPDVRATDQWARDLIVKINRERADAGCVIYDLTEKRKTDAAEIARLRAAVERLTRDRDLAERKAAVCREDAEINARRAESAESRVAELEEVIGAWAQAHDGTNFSVQSETSAQLRALLSPRPAPLPDLTFDADDPLPDMTPAPIQEPKCGEGGAA